MAAATLLKFFPRQSGEMEEDNEKLVERKSVLIPKNKKLGKKSEEPPRKKKKLSTQYADELDKISDINLDEVQTNLDLLKVMRKTLISTLGTARGAFKTDPNPSNLYAMTKVVKDIQDITRAIETAFDYDEFTNIIFEEVIKPFVEKSLLSLGSHIKDSLEAYGGDDPKKFKKLEKVLTETYRKYGADLEGQIPGLQTKLRKTVLKNAK